MYYNVGPLFEELSKSSGLPQYFWYAWSFLGFFPLILFYTISEKTKGIIRYFYIVIGIITGGPIVWTFAIVIGFLCLCACFYDFLNRSE